MPLTEGGESFLPGHDPEEDSETPSPITSSFQWPEHLAAISRGAGSREKRQAFDQSCQPSWKDEWLPQEVLGNANQDGVDSHKEV